MGNYKFRLSDMMPNAWLYKLKDIRANKNHPSKKKHQPISSSTSSSSSLSSTGPQAHASKSKPREAHTMSQHRKSYYFTRDLIPSTSPPSFDETFYNNTIIAATSHKATLETNAPRKSSKRRRSTRRINKQLSPKPARLAKSTVSANCSCRATLESDWTAKPDSTSEDYPNSPLDSSSENDSLMPEFGSASDQGLTPSPGLETFDGMVSWSTSCHCSVQNDLVIDLANNKQPIHAKISDEFNLVSEIELPPIINKPTKVTNIDTVANKMQNNCIIDDSEQNLKCQRSVKIFDARNAQETLSVKVVKDENIISTKEQRTTPIRKYSVHSPGLKLRTNSPRLASRKIQGRKSVSSSSSSSSRRSLSESCAVVKSSVDPQRDFRESMVEMIVENNIRASKDLEDLLACYLSLNADEYHDLIIKVFKQIWFDITDIQLK